MPWPAIREGPCRVGRWRPGGVIWHRSEVHSLGAAVIAAVLAGVVTTQAHGWLPAGTTWVQLRSRSWSRPAFGDAEVVVRRVYWAWSYRLDDLATRVEQILDQHPNAHLVAFSHAVTPVRARGDLNFDVGRGLFWQPSYIGILRGDRELDLLYTAMLVLEEPVAAKRYPQPPEQLPGPPSS